MNQIFFGNARMMLFTPNGGSTPPAPVTHEETWYKYADDTEWRTVMLGGTIALFDDEGNPSGQIENPNDIVAIEIGTGTQANPVISIEDGAFGCCYVLSSVTIPDSVTSINGNNAFNGCSDTLFDITTIPGVKLVDGWVVGYTGAIFGDLVLTGVRGIAAMAFADFIELTSITIPDNITSIGENLFINCTGLTSVTVGNNVTSIGDGAFSNCSSLTNMTIPASVTSIGQCAFLNCNELTNITINCFDISTTKSLITNNLIFGDAFYDLDTYEPFEKTFLVTCTDGSFNVTFGIDYSITFTDL